MWFFFALAFAVITSIGTLIAKRVMKEVDEYTYLALSGLFTLPFLFVIIITFYSVPHVDPTFFSSISISIFVGVFAAIFAYRAIRISEVSLVAPISAFNPVFTTLFAWIMLGEIIKGKGVIGIALICIGAYLLQLSKAKESIFQPLKALVLHKGVQLSFIAYLLWAITPIFEKTAIFHTAPVVPPFAAFVGFVGTTVIFLLITLLRSRNSLTKIKSFFPWFVIIGILGAVGQAAAMIAFSSGNLGFVTAIFKLSMLITVVLGWFFFKEKQILNKLIGVMVMLAGVIVLVT